jgi:uncharacterized cupredoxin-like copper-binding protein
MLLSGNVLSTLTALRPGWLGSCARNEVAWFNAGRTPRTKAPTRRQHPAEKWAATKEDTMKAMLVGLVASAVIANVAAASAQASPALARGSHATAIVKRVNVAASEMKFVLSAKTAKRGVVIFRVTNVGALKHDFEIKGRTTRQLAHGQSATLRVVFLRKGQYPYKCTVPGHAAAGMKGVFTIS